MARAGPSSLYNHCLQTYVLGCMNATALGLRINREAAFVSSILHDAGLTAAHAGDPAKTFERNGAEFARALVAKLAVITEPQVIGAILAHLQTRTARAAPPLSSCVAPTCP